MEFLFLVKERRVDSTSYFHMLIKYLREQGHICKLIDPTLFLNPDNYDYYAVLDNEYDMNSINMIQYYDAVFYSNRPILFDVSKVNIPTFLIYDEIWKGVKIPKGTKYLITAEAGVDVLRWSDSSNFVRLKGTFDKLRGVIDPSTWSIGKKTIPLAYMGLMRPQRKQNILLQGMIWDTKQKFVSHLMEKHKVDYNPGGREYWEFVKTFPNVDVCIHFSNEKNVGQGAWEALACGCILLEYPNGSGAKEAGLIDRENCFLFDTIEELDDCIEAIFVYIDPMEMDDIRKKGIELAKEHTYKSLQPIEDFILEMLKNE